MTRLLLALILASLLLAAPASAVDLNGSSQYLNYTTNGACVDTTCTWVAWFRWDNVSGVQASILTNLGTTDFASSALLLSGIDDSDVCGYRGNDANDDVIGACETPVSVNTWHFVAMTLESSSSSWTFLDSAANKTQATSTGTNTAGDDIWIGAIDLFGGGVDYYFPGDIAHAAVWDAALSDEQIDQLANGADPRKVGSPMSCWPLIRDGTDWCGSRNLTGSGSPSYDGDNPLRRRVM